MTSSSCFRALLAASLCVAPLGWAAAQDQGQNDQHQHQDRPAPNQQHSPQQQPQQNQPQQHTQPPPGNTAPRGQHVGAPPAGGPGASGQQFQHPAQNNAAPPGAQSFQRPPQNNAPPPPSAQSFQRPPSPPAGASASPTPPPSQSQFQRVQGPPPNGGGAPAGSAQPQQQFQQRSGQRGGAPVGAAPPQQQQQTTVTRGNFQGGSRSANTAAFTQQHGGAAPTQFDHGRFYGRDYAHFTPHEATLWHRGAWRHEFHDGRFGWWYAVDGIWYFYDQPIYPYPTFVPDVVYIPEEEDAPPVYVDEPPEPEQYDQPDDQSASYYYYFCQDTQTYYPYVTSCASPWLPVPAVPPQ